MEEIVSQVRTHLIADLSVGNEGCMYSLQRIDSITFETNTFRLTANSF